MKKILLRIIKNGLLLFSTLTFCSCLSLCYAQEISPLNKNISYMGRWKLDNKYAYCAQGATYIKVKFTGTSIGARIAGENCIWEYSIDDGDFINFKPKDELTILADKLVNKEHSLILLRSTEGEAGMSTFKGLVIDDGATIEKADIKSLKLEFVGDSIVAGFFNDEGGIDEIRKEDGNMSFAPQLARMLDAEYSVVAKSGEGVVRNCDDFVRPYDGVHTADRYPWTFFSRNKNESHEIWNSKNFPVDAVIVAIGINDFLETTLSPSKEEFIKEYTRLIKEIRKLNPKAKIICTEPVPTFTEINPAMWIKEAVNDSGDAEAYFIQVNKDKPLLDSDDFVGDDCHPTKEGSEKIALYLKSKVENILIPCGSADGVMDDILDIQSDTHKDKQDKVERVLRFFWRSIYEHKVHSLTRASFGLS